MVFARRASPHSSLPTLPGAASAVLAASPGDGCYFRFLVQTSQASIRTYSYIVISAFFSLLFFLFFFVSIPFIIFALLFFLPPSRTPSRNSDPVVSNDLKPSVEEVCKIWIWLFRNVSCAPSRVLRGEGFERSSVVRMARGKTCFRLPFRRQEAVRARQKTVTANLNSRDLMYRLGPAPKSGTRPI